MTDTIAIAASIRKALKAEFPGQKFSVRTSRFSMGSSVDVSWIDGPRSEDVEAIVNQFQEVRSQYLMCSRKISAELREKVAAMIDESEFEAEAADDRFLTRSDFAFRVIQIPTRYPVSGWRAGLISAAEAAHAAGFEVAS